MKILKIAYLVFGLAILFMGLIAVIVYGNTNLVMAIVAGVFITISGLKMLLKHKNVGDAK